MVMRILFAAWASPHIGVGHVVRMGTLARAAQACGHQVSMLSDRHSESAVQWAWDGLHTIHLTPQSGIAALQEELPDSPDWLVVDSYEMDSELLSLLAGRVRTVVMDDVPDRDLSLADLVVNPNLGVTIDEYTGPALVGPVYACIREPFSRYRHCSGGSTTLLIAGGTDATGLIDECLATLNGTNIPITVVGRTGINSHGVTFAGRRNADELARDMASCRGAVVAAGSVVWEALTIGVPFVAIPVAENQSRIAQGLKASGWAEVLSRGRLEELPNCLAVLPQHGKPRLDGHGSQRIVAAMESM